MSKNELKACLKCRSEIVGAQCVEHENIRDVWGDICEADWFVECFDCGLKSANYSTKAEAIAAWNERVPDPRIIELEAENIRLRKWNDTLRANPSKSVVRRLDIQFGKDAKDV